MTYETGQLSARCAAACICRPGTSKRTAQRYRERIIPGLWRLLTSIISGRTTQPPTLACLGAGTVRRRSCCRTGLTAWCSLRGMVSGRVSRRDCRISREIYIRGGRMSEENAAYPPVAVLARLRWMARKCIRR